MADAAQSRPAGAQLVDGIMCYAPELARDGSDYPAEAFERLVALEDRNFWFRSRNRIIARAFRKFLAAAGRPRVLEIGCGTGYVLSALAAENRYDLTGAEVNVAGLVLAKRRLPEIEFVQVDARDLPFAGEFDAIGAFDVIEHIQEDERVIASVRRALVPGGLFFVTVPQHPWLWSRSDDDARHKRRYSRHELVAKLEDGGFEVACCTSFVFLLLPLMIVSRLAKPGNRGQTPDEAAAMDELDLPRALNALLEAVMRLDELLIALGVALPAGGSLLAVARKRPA